MVNKIYGIIFWVFIFCFVGFFSYSQENDGVYEIDKQIYHGNMPVVVNQFYDALLKVIVVENINEQRIKRKLEPYKTHEIFDSVARNQANYMKNIKAETTRQKGKYKTTAKRDTFGP